MVGRYCIGGEQTGGQGGSQPTRGQDEAGRGRVHPGPWGLGRPGVRGVDYILTRRCLSPQASAPPDTEHVPGGGAEVWRAPDGVGAVLGLISGSPAWKPCPKASDHGLPPAVRRKEEEVKTDRPSLSLSPSGLPDVFCELARRNQNLLGLALHPHLRKECASHTRL